MSTVSPHNYSDKPGDALLRASNAADSMPATATIAILLNTQNGNFDTQVFTAGLTYSQAIALLDIQKARLIKALIDSDREADAPSS